MIDRDPLSTDEDFEQALRSVSPEAMQEHLLSIREQEREEIKRVQEAYDDANAERAERRSNQP